MICKIDKVFKSPLPVIGLVLVLGIGFPLGACIIGGLTSNPQQQELLE
jgi:hypothetical protein